MNKILLFGISIMLYFVLAGALHCLVCNQYKPDTGCIHGKSSCETEPGQKCKTVIVKKKNGRVFQRKGCSEESACDQDIFNLASIEVTRCCNNSDFCNADGNVLHCLVCKKFDPQAGCLQGKSSCETPKGQKCKTETVTKKNGQQFQRTGCTKEPNQCDTSIIKGAITIKTECCDDRSFCNGLVGSDA